MVGIRCKMVVRDELIKLGLHYAVVELGEMEVLENISAAQQEQFKVALLKSGPGLATTNEILRSGDVVVNIESALGQGTKFILMFPRYPC